VGGGLLALGLALALLPGLFRNATGLASPLFQAAQIGGLTALVSSLLIFGALAIRMIAHASRRASVR
jgi:hypothetical protein